MSLVQKLQLFIDTKQGEIARLTKERDIAEASIAAITKSGDVGIIRSESTQMVVMRFKDTGEYFSGTIDGVNRVKTLTEAARYHPGSFPRSLYDSETTDLVYVEVATIVTVRES